MTFNSKKYPNITYEKGESIYESLDMPNGAEFFLSVDADLTQSDEGMNIAAAALDEADVFEEKAKAFIKSVLADDTHERYETVSLFMEFHKEELDSDTLSGLFSAGDPETLTFSEMAEHLRIVRFGCDIDSDDGTPVFIIDLSFDPDITDELLVVYFDSNREIFHVSHES